MIEEINWNRMWIEATENASWRTRRGDMTEFWNKRARRYSESLKHNDRSMQMISKLDTDPECTVLDIGAGPGTLTIPLAKIVKHVTVVEPSSEMLACLKKNAADEGLTNITCINRKWEDAIPGADLDEYDVVIASYSLAMLDMKAALSKMNRVARRSVYLFTFAGDRAWDYNELWHRLYGEEYRAAPDYIYLYNILHGMGIHADVEIADTEYKERFSSMDEAVEQWMENFDATTPEAEEVIRSYLSENLVMEDGAFWSKHEMKGAMIHWRKDNGN
jgi:ubiquinone/menaquinone biosynthesis C-methylase UbiE